MDMRMQFYDFGAHPKIELPAEAQGLDYTPMLRAELGLEDGSTVGSLISPTGAKPLSSAAFQNRVLGICRKVEG